MKQTQYRDILRYLEEFGSITTMEAFSQLGITKLSTRISEMISRGFVFKKEIITDRNRYGRNIHYMRYSLVKAL